MFFKHLLVKIDLICAKRRLKANTKAWNTDAPEPEKKEFFSSWALFILIMLLIGALFTSYILQQRKIQAVHETVLSIFGGEYPPNFS